MPTRKNSWPTAYKHSHVNTKVEKRQLFLCSITRVNKKQFLRASRPKHVEVMRALLLRYYLTSPHGSFISTALRILISEAFQASTVWQTFLVLLEKLLLPICCQVDLRHPKKARNNLLTREGDYSMGSTIKCFWKPLARNFLFLYCHEKPEYSKPLLSSGQGEIRYKRHFNTSSGNLNTSVDSNTAILL